MIRKIVFLLILFFWVGTDMQSQVVIRGPYLQSSSETGITVRWRTHILSTSKVTYGTSITNLNLSTMDATMKINHEVRITGLNPGTKYYYNIGTIDSVLSVTDEEQYFKTHPQEGNTDIYKFWILGDCGTANIDQRNVRDAYYNYVGTEHTDGILFLGDNAYHTGSDGEYQFSLFQNMYEGKMKNTTSWSTLGNHDGFSASSSSQTGNYYDIFSFPRFGESGGISSGTEAYYSFDYGNIHFVCLDSYDSDRSVGGAMYNWCMNDLQNTTQKWLVAFWHHPPYTKGTYDSDTELEESEMRQNFLPMLEDNGIDLVLSGHSHTYERSYFINGHYGVSSTFDPNINTVGDNGYSDGRIGQGGSYKKLISGENVNDGAVYITAGNSGKVSSNPDFGHNAMYYSVSELGSCVLEVEGDQLDVKFIRDTGTIEDFFTIEKEVENCVPGTNCDDDDNDGTCNELDQCPGFHDGLIGPKCIENSGGCPSSICSCDFNQDGIVDGDDFSLFLGHFGSSCAICCPTDLNGTGITDSDDFAIFLGNFGCI